MFLHYTVFSLIVHHLYTSSIQAKNGSLAILVQLFNVWIARDKSLFSE